MEMDWTTILVSLIGALFGGGIVTIVTLPNIVRQSNSKTLASFDKVYADRLDQLREELDYERKRNVALDEQLRKEIDYERARNKELIQRNDDKERRYAEQTNRLRETQDRELKANEKILELTKQGADKDLELAHKRCELSLCPWREPPTAATPPKPEGMSREEWHLKRLGKTE